MRSSAGYIIGPIKNSAHYVTLMLSWSSYTQMIRNPCPLIALEVQRASWLAQASIYGKTDGREFQIVEVLFLYFWNSFLWRRVLRGLSFMQAISVISSWYVYYSILLLNYLYEVIAVYYFNA